MSILPRSAEENEREVIRSEMVENDLNPNWSLLKIPLDEIFPPSFHAELVSNATKGVGELDLLMNSTLGHRKRKN
jgi:hypothetical protein